MQIFAFLGILSAKGFLFKLLIKVFFWLHQWQRRTIAGHWKGLRFANIVKYQKYLFSAMDDPVPNIPV